MLESNLALKLEEFEDDYCNFHLVDDCEQNLPDNIIRFPISKMDYDNNGNLIQKTDKTTLETTAYTYNAENQLICIDFSDGTYAEYKYDGLDRRIEKNVNGGIVRYVYDGEDILLEYDDTNTLTARYTHGLRVDEPLIMDRASQSYFYHVDALGSITALTDVSGNIAQTYIYDSFGNIVAQTGTIQNPYTYTGREFDSESGLYYYRARYYDAKVGRFITVDPTLRLYLSEFGCVMSNIGVMSTNNIITGFGHFYIYVENNPVNYTDPTGLDGENCCVERFHRGEYWTCICICNAACFTMAIPTFVGALLPPPVGTAVGGATAIGAGAICGQKCANYCVRRATHCD